MADIIIRIEACQTPAEGDVVKIEGMARCTGMTPEDMDITWSVDVDPGDLAATINDACKDAAIAAAEAREYTIGALDKKTLIGGAVGL
jgi:hypothetical protein